MYPPRPSRRPRTLRRALAALAALTLLVAGCSPITSSHDDEPAPASADGASADELIGAALEEGRIDEPTASAYYTLALFNAPELPEEYRGGVASHNVAAMVHLRENLEELPEELADDVAPYLLRPSDPGSAFSQSDGPQVRTVATGEDRQPCSGWVTSPQRGPDPDFRVWVCEDIGTADEVEEALSTILDNVDAYAPAIFDGFGKLMADDASADPSQQSDDLIDIYVLPQGFFAPSRGGQSVELWAAGLAVPAAPVEGNGSSGYALLSSHLLEEYPELVAAKLVHELTHVAQMAWNFRLLGTESQWLAEASARWAEYHFAPDLPEGSNQQIHTMQNTGLPIDAPRTQYTAYIWLLYLQQERGTQAVLDLWSDLADATEEDAAITVMEEVLGPWEEHLPAFALRLLNAELPGDPIGPLFPDIDPSIPRDYTPEVTAQGLGPVDITDVPGLGWRYSLLTRDAGEPERVDVMGDIDDSLRIQAVISGGDGYRVEEVSVGTPLCFGGESAWLVAANTARDGASSGDLTLEPTGESCDDVVEEPEPEAGTGADAEAPAGTAPSGRPSAPSEASTRTPTTAGEFCDDLEAFTLRIGGIADLAMLPYSSSDVAEIFDLIDPYAATLPDDGPAQVQILREAAEAGADLSAAEAADVLDDPQVRQASASMNQMLGDYCRPG